MLNELQLKKVLAKETLFFFAGVLLVLLLYFFLFFRNSYYNRKVIYLKEKMYSLASQLDTLPSDNIKSLYDELSHSFVVHYQAEKGKYAITKEYQNEFLVKNYNLGNKVKPLLPFENGFSFFRLSNTDSMLVFDFLELNNFREKLKTKVYRDNLFTEYSDNPNNTSKDPNSLALPPFLRSRLYKQLPYHLTLDLGTSIEFENYILAGLKYYKEADILKFDLTQKRQLINSSIEIASSNILKDKKILSYILTLTLVIGIILYPIRLSYKLVQWAFKTLKQN